jgi:Ca2+:H+ antiporter
VYGFYLLFQLKTHRERFGAKPKQKQNYSYSDRERSNHGEWDDSDSEQIDPGLNLWTAITALIVSTVLIAFNTAFAVDKIDSITYDHVPASFVGLILLPILGNDLTPIKCAIIDMMDLSLITSAGKSLQTSLLVTPLVVIIAWIWGIDEMDLLFDGFQVASLFVAVLLFNFQILNGKSD